MIGGGPAMPRDEPSRNKRPPTTRGHSSRVPPLPPDTDGPEKTFQ